MSPVVRPPICEELNTCTAYVVNTAACDVLNALVCVDV
jgi:hypothetical protein